jgi:hypothetical protein
VLHRCGQIGKVTDSAHPCRLHDLAERTGHPPSVTLVKTQILEERVVLVLREVRPDADMVLAGRCGSRSQSPRHNPRRSSRFLSLGRAGTSSLTRVVHRIGRVDAASSVCKNPSHSAGPPLFSDAGLAWLLPRRLAILGQDNQNIDHR